MFMTKVFTMLFYKMSRNNHNTSKNPIFSCIFQHGENFLPLSNFKILTLSKNTLQNLTVTNTITNLPNLTTVRYFLPYGKILKGETLQNYKISTLNAINSMLPSEGLLQKVNPSEKKTIQCQQKTFFTDPIITPMQPYSYYSKRQFTNVTKCLLLAGLTHSPRLRGDKGG